MCQVGSKTIRRLSLSLRRPGAVADRDSRHRDMMCEPQADLSPTVTACQWTLRRARAHRRDQRLARNKDFRVRRVRCPRATRLGLGVLVYGGARVLSLETRNPNLQIRDIQ